MKTSGLYIASVTAKGNGLFTLNDCWIEADYDELRIGDVVTDSANNQFELVNYENYPARGIENLWLDVEWVDYPDSDISPIASITQDYDSSIGSLKQSKYTPDVSYLCRIASVNNSYPAYHYSLVLTDARVSDPGAGLGAVGDYIIDKSGQIFKIIEWNGWEQPCRVHDIENRPYKNNNSNMPVEYDYAYLYRTLDGAPVIPNADYSDLGDDAQDTAINISNSEHWTHRGVSISTNGNDLDNVTKITIGSGLEIKTTTNEGWNGGQNIELLASTVLEGSFTSSSRQSFSATADQVKFDVDYEIGFIDVYMNGFKLVLGLDVHANNGTAIFLEDAAVYGDTIDIIAYDTFNIANHYTVGQIDSSFVNTVGNTTIDGELTANAFNLSSARILKENISPFVLDGLGILSEINVMNFTYKSDSSRNPRVGFIADDTDKLLSGEFQDNFDMGNTVGVLIKAIQELTYKVKDLEDKLNVK